MGGERRPRAWQSLQDRRQRARTERSQERKSAGPAHLALGTGDTSHNHATAMTLPRSLAVLTGWLLCVPALLAQTPAPTADKGPASKTVLELILHGGPLIILIWLCILGTSIVMVTFIIQNVMTLKADKLAPPPMVDALKQAVHSGNYQEAWETCRANDNYLANVLRSGLERLGRGKDTFEDALAEAGMREA